MTALAGREHSASSIGQEEERRRRTPDDRDNVITLTHLQYDSNNDKVRTTCKEIPSRAVLLN